MVVAPAFGITKPAKYKMGLQLYTVRDAMERDLSGTLQKIAAMGYEDLETYGFNPDDVKYYGLKATELRSALDDLGLSTSSGHYDLFKFLETPTDALDRYVDRCIEGASTLGQRYITWPWLAPESRSIVPAGSITFRPKIHGPVSTTT